MCVHTIFIYQLTLYLLSQEAHPASTATSSALRTPSLHPNAAFTLVVHQHTKLKVAGSSPTEVHFSSYPKNVQTNQATLGLVPLDLNNHYV